MQIVNKITKVGEKIPSSAEDICINEWDNIGIYNFYIGIIANSDMRTTVISPQTAIDSPLIASSISPNS